MKLSDNIHNSFNGLTEDSVYLFGEYSITVSNKNDKMKIKSKQQQKKLGT